MPRSEHRTQTRKIADGAVVQRTAQVRGHVTSYGEGPDAGPPLLLLHGQGSQWQDYATVLPTLVAHHHVYALDVYGHGQSARLEPGDYTNARVGELVAAFVDDVVGGPAIVSGHSSGGILALWLAASRPDLVRALLLEDPPLFSSVPPRAEKTTGAVISRLAVAYLAMPPSDRPRGGFQRYYVEHANYFAFFGPFARPLTRYALRRIDARPDEPLRIPFLPQLVNVFFEGMVHYDPAFGAAWDDGAWYDGFDTASALERVSAPATLLHTTWWHDKHGTSYDDDGVLMAAMDADDAARAMSLLPDAELVGVRSGHLVHVEKPAVYLEALRAVAARAR